MSVGKSVALNTFVRDLFQVGIYKRSQGRFTRQLTCLAIWIGFALAAWRTYDVTMSSTWRYTVPTILLAIGLWGGFRLVNYPQFADFLIAVEAEMNKVSWPSLPELSRSAIVVIFVIFALSMILYAFDAIWTFLFKAIGLIG